MSLALPAPSNPQPTSAAQVRARRKWQSGQAHAEREQWGSAAQEFEQAYAMHDDAAYGLAAAHALITAGRPDAAAACAKKLRQRRPALALAYTLESHAWLERGRPDEAVACLRALPADAARDHAYGVSLGVALQRCHRHDEAIEAFLQALAHKMNDGVTHFRLGMSFKDKGMKAEAAECVRTALLLGLGSSDLAARGQMAFLEREACRWTQAEEALDQLRAALRKTPAGTVVETGPFPHAVLVDDPLEQLQVAQHYALHVASRVQPLPRRTARAHAGRLRIGYLSADFHQHATSQLMAQMLECHDRERFEVTLVSAGQDDGTPMRRRMEAACERFEDVRAAGAQAIASRIRELGIDILVDLKGATHGSLLPVVAHRPAPLQVSWLGFPGTTGAPYIDYFIGDPVVTPIANAAHFSEKIAQLPHCYQPNDAERPLPAATRRADWGLPQDALVLCAFHQSYKISREVFDTWCALLHELPGAVLWLMRWNTNVQSTLEAAARARGIDTARLLFAPMIPPDQHLSRLACADVYLDAWPCNAHTTAGEALWAGLPVVTRIGETFAQRVAASLLHTVGLDELVCTDDAGYRRSIVALAGDAARRARLRERLIGERRTNPLFDGRRFARDIEALYERMWQRAVSGHAPEHLPAAPAAQG
jgi:protein O-GlcNAc transferase